MTDISFRKLELAVGKLTDEVKNWRRDVKDLKRDMEAIMDDRPILEDIQGSIRMLQELIIQNQAHQDDSKKRLVSDIKEVKNTVEDKLEEALAAPPVPKKNLLKKLFKK